MGHCYVHFAFLFTLNNGMILAIFILSGNIPLRSDELHICVTGFTIEHIILLTSFILRPSLSIDVLLLQLLNE